MRQGAIHRLSRLARCARQDHDSPGAERCHEPAALLPPHYSHNSKEATASTNCAVFSQTKLCPRTSSIPYDFRKCQLFCATAGSASPATPRESAESRSQGAERNRSSSFSHCECHSQPPWCARSGACGLEHADCPNHSPPARHPPTPPKKIVLQHAGNSSNASHTHKRQRRASRRPRCANIHATQHPYLTPRVDGDENGPSV